MSSRFKIVVMASGSGTLLQSLLEAERDSRLNAEIVAVASEIPSAPALDRAKSFNKPVVVVPMETPFPLCSARRLLWDAAITEKVSEYSPDLIVLAGFMKLFSAPFLNKFGGKIINTHPALLPAFPGAHAVRDALEAGAQVTGCSIFWVDAGVDTGELIAQREVPVLAGDDEPTLHERIKQVERELLVETINNLAVGETPGGRVSLPVLEPACEI